MEKVPNLLSESADWMKDIFGKTKVCKYSVYVFFFQLIGAGILKIDYEGNDGLRFLLARDDAGNYVYDDVKAWKGFEFRRSGRGHNSVTFDALVRAEMA